MKHAALVLFVVALPAVVSAQARYRRPVACDSCIAGWYYFDHDGGTGDQDWNCGSSSYDGHRGSDFSLAGGNGAISGAWQVVAAADGVVEASADGFFDMCTTCDASADSRCGTAFSGGFGNFVRITHGDTSVVYGHMRNGSIRVHTGDTVRCGDVIGEIGSSGCTTGAHLHFEPRPMGGSYLTAFDPFNGGCSSAASRWVSQGGYRSMPAPTCSGGTTPMMCPTGWYDIWTCSGSDRRRCISGVTMTESCAPGVCEGRPTGTDDACDADSDGYATDEGDCVDSNTAVHPGAAEVCGNGLDDDCSSGDLSCGPADADGDGYAASIDCDDANGTVHPGATEVCGNGLDDDCAGGDRACSTTDGDEDGWGDDVDCDDGDPTVHPGAPDVCNDGIDQDCLGGDVSCTIPDTDMDGYRSDVDCDDTRPAVHPGAIEICGNALDDDCSGGDRACAGTDAGAALDARPGDAGRTGPRDGLSGGCGCRASRRGPDADLLLLVLGAVVVRGRRFCRSSASS